MYFQSIYNDTLGQRMLQVFKKYTILVTCYLYFCVTDDKRDGCFVTLMNNRPLFCGTIIMNYYVIGYVQLSSATSAATCIFGELLSDKNRDIKASYPFFQKFRDFVFE